MKKIYLNAHIYSDLEWQPSLLQAEGEDSISWQLDLGLFYDLPKPLSDDTQFHTLELAIDHFHDLVWKKFPEQTKEVCIYEGSADFSRSIIWDEKLNEHYHQWLSSIPESPETPILFCRDVGSRYMRLLTDNLLDEVPLKLKLDLAGIDSLQLQAQLISRACYQRFQLEVTGAKIPIVITGEEKLALCLPEEAVVSPILEETLQKLITSSEPFRIIPEPMLTTEWDGLDRILVLQDKVTPQCERKLMGFRSAGGEVISL